MAERDIKRDREVMELIALPEYAKVTFGPDRASIRSVKPRIDGGYNVIFDLADEHQVAGVAWIYNDPTAIPCNRVYVQLDQ